MYAALVCVCVCVGGGGCLSVEIMGCMYYVQMNKYIHLFLFLHICHWQINPVKPGDKSVYFVTRQTNLHAHSLTSPIIMFLLISSPSKHLILWSPSRRLLSSGTNNIQHIDAMHRKGFFYITTPWWVACESDHGGHRHPVADCDSKSIWPNSAPKWAAWGIHKLWHFDEDWCISVDSFHRLLYRVH